MLLILKRKFLISSFVFLFINLGVGLVFADSGDPVGGELFEENCAGCHGEDGMPLLPGTPDFSKGERLEKTDDELLESIGSGLNVMPPWDGILSEKEMKNCLGFIRSISKK